jgi:hypothetical protein
MADIYVEKDWNFIDKANRKVLDYVLSINESDPDESRNTIVTHLPSKLDKSIKK